MSISEIHVGSLIRVKIGKNLILAKVVEILDGAVRVCSVANNKEFNVPQESAQFGILGPILEFPLKIRIVPALNLILCYRKRRSHDLYFDFFPNFWFSGVP